MLDHLTNGWRQFNAGQSARIAAPLSTAINRKKALDIISALSQRDVLTKEKIMTIIFTVYLNKKEIMYVLWNQSIFFFCFCLFFILIHIKLIKVICLTRLHYKTSLSTPPHCTRHSPSCKLGGALWPGCEGIKTWMKVDFFLANLHISLQIFLYTEEKKKLRQFYTASYIFYTV